MSPVDNHIYETPDVSTNRCTHTLAAKVAVVACCLCLAAVVASVTLHFLEQDKWTKDLEDHIEKQRQLAAELRASEERIVLLENRTGTNDQCQDCVLFRQELIGATERIARLESDTDLDRLIEERLALRNEFNTFKEIIRQLENSTGANGQCQNHSQLWQELIGVSERIVKLENETALNNHTTGHLEIVTELRATHERILQLENRTAADLSEAFRLISVTADQCQNCSHLGQEMIGAKERILRLENATVTASEDAIRSCLLNALTAAEDNIKFLENRTLCNSTVTSCDEVTLQQIPYHMRNITGGEVEIEIPSVGNTNVFCDLTTDDGNWIVFQRRMDGSVEFNRNWFDYVNGFGTPRGEFWLGLEAIHQLTNVGYNELRVDMIEKNGTHYYATYNSFALGSSSDNYKIHLGVFSGNVSNTFQYVDGQQFSTKDRDNDLHSSVHCALVSNTGWWYRACHHGNLNGAWGGNSGANGIMWRSGTDLFMRFTEMKIRIN